MRDHQIAAALSAALLAAACADDSSPLNVVPTEPATIQVVAAADPQAGTVGSVVTESPGVRIEDRHGNAVPGVVVQFSVTAGDGQVGAAVDTTDLEGIASTEWRLGTTVGANALEGRVDGLEAVTFRARGVPDVPSAIVIDGGDGQSGRFGAELPDPLAARVTDRFGNGISAVPVAWTVIEGGGSVEVDTTLTDVFGLAKARYTLGRSAGTERVRASARDFEPVDFTIDADAPNNYTIGGAYLTQAIQRPDGSVPLVAGRDGILRVFVNAEARTSLVPDVVVRLYDGGALVHEETIPAPDGPVPLAAGEASLATSWNLQIPGELIRSGVEITAAVDPGDDFVESDEADNTFPTAGAIRPDVIDLPGFRVRLVPIHIPELNATGDVDEGNMHEYLTVARAMFPFPDFDVDVREPYTIDSEISGGYEWGVLLNEIWQLRLDEGTPRYYYGVIPRGATARYCGMAYIASPSGRQEPGAAVGLDGCGASTAAHEWGHNFGRRHAPCGDPAGPDPAYPYPNASIGVYGMDVGGVEIRAPQAYRDLMSYCGPEWISDYTYEAIIDYRRARAEAAAQAPHAAREPVLIVAGRVRDGRIELDPTFESTGHPARPVGGGPFRMEGRAADGTTLFSIAFDAERIDHLPPGERHFAFALPIDEVGGDRLDRLRITGAGLTPATIARPAADALADRAAVVEAVRQAPSRVRLEWDASAFPRVVVRHPVTGALLALARGGSAVVRTDAEELDLRLSPGIGAVHRRVRVR